MFSKSLKVANLLQNAYQLTIFLKSVFSTLIAKLSKVPYFASGLIVTILKKDWLSSLPKELKCYVEFVFFSYCLPGENFELPKAKNYLLGRLLLEKKAIDLC